MTIKKNDRVIVKAGKNEWFTGVVTRSGATKMAVTFDDKMISIIDAEDFRDVKPLLIDFKSLEPLSDEEAKKLYQKQKSKPGAIVITKAQADEEEREQNAAWAAKLMTHLQPKLYEGAFKTRNPARISRWMEVQYSAMNHAYFTNELQRPALAVMSVTDEKRLRCRGLWKANQRHLLLGISLFDLDEFMVLKSLLHEMAHQAVSEIDKLVGVGHGENWQRWMYRLGMPVYLQSDLTHDVPTMLKFEPDDPKDLPLATLPAPAAPEPGVAPKRFEPLRTPPYNTTPAMWLSGSGMWRRGVVIGQWNQDSGFVQFLSVPSLDKVKKVGLNEVFKMPEDQTASVRTPEWQASIARVTSALKLKARIFRVYGQVVCAVCGSTINTQTDVAVKIDGQTFDIKHAAEHLHMPSADLQRMVETRQLSET